MFNQPLLILYGTVAVFSTGHDQKGPARHRDAFMTPRCGRSTQRTLGTSIAAWRSTQEGSEIFVGGRPHLPGQTSSQSIFIWEYMGYYGINIDKHINHLVDLVTVGNQGW